MVLCKGLGIIGRQVEGIPHVIPGVAVDMVGIGPHRSVSHVVELKGRHGPGTSLGHHLPGIVDIDPVAILVVLCLGCRPGIPRGKTGSRALGDVLLVGMGIVQVNGPVLEGSDGKAPVHAGVIGFLESGIGGFQFVGRASQGIPVFSGHRIGGTPPVNIEPWVGGGGAGGITVTFDPLGIHAAAIDLQPVVHVGTDPHRTVVALEIVNLGGLDDPILVEVAHANVVLGAAAFAADRQTVGLRRRPLLHHIIIGIIGAQTDLAAVGVDIPVAAIQHGIVGFDHVAPFLFPFDRLFVPFTGHHPEGAGHRAANPLESPQGILQGIDTPHLHLLGDVLEGEVPRIGDVDALGLGPLLGSDQDHPEGGLGSVNGGGCRIFKHRYRFDVVGIDHLNGGNLHVIKQNKG